MRIQFLWRRAATHLLFILSPNSFVGGVNDGRGGIIGATEEISPVCIVIQIMTVTMPLATKASQLFRSKSSPTEAPIEETFQPL